MESSARLFFTFWGALPALFYFLGAGWAPLATLALPPVLILKYGISYRLLQNFYYFATLNLSAP